MADLVARFLPLLSFEAVVDNAIPDREGKLQSALSSLEMPNEDDYNDAITAVLRKLNYTVSNPKNGKGKTDVVVTFTKDGKQESCAVESVLASRGQVRGYCRLFDLAISARYSSPLFLL